MVKVIGKLSQPFCLELAWGLSVLSPTGPPKRIRMHLSRPQCQWPYSGARWRSSRDILYQQIDEVEQASATIYKVQQPIATSKCEVMVVSFKKAPSLPICSVVVIPSRALVVISWRQLKKPSIGVVFRLWKYMGAFFRGQLNPLSARSTYLYF